MHFLEVLLKRLTGVMLQITTMGSHPPKVLPVMAVALGMSQGALCEETASHLRNSYPFITVRLSLNLYRNHSVRYSH